MASALLQITKIEAATVQLTTAIRLLFEGEHPIVIHALASSAANLLSDLSEGHGDAKCWRNIVRNANDLSKKEIKFAMNKSWNFLKHADTDATEILELDIYETEHLLFLATLEYGELASTPIEVQVFQLWFLAADRIKLSDIEDNPLHQIQKTSKEYFPNLANLTHKHQLSFGLMRLNEAAELI